MKLRKDKRIGYIVEDVYLIFLLKLFLYDFMGLVFL